MHTATRPHRREYVISPIALALVLTGAVVVALIPFAILLVGLRWGSERWIPLMLAGVTVFILLFPLLLRFFTPGPRRSVHR